MSAAPTSVVAGRHEQRRLGRGFSARFSRAAVNRIRVVVDADDVDGAEQAGGDRQHAGAGADVEDGAPRARRAAAARRHSRVVA